MANALAAYIGLSLAVLIGCQKTPSRHIAESPTVSVTPAGGVVLSGDTPNPANVTTSETGSKVVVPEGSKVVFNEKQGTTEVVMAKPTEMAVNRKETTVKGPVAFTPDKAPTIAEEKQAESDFWSDLGLKAGVLIGAACAIFGLVRGWNLVMYGGVALLGASLFGIFIQRHPFILSAIGIGVALIVVGPIIWHTKLKNAKSDNTDANQ